MEAVDGPRFGPVRADLSDDNFLLVSQAFLAVAESVNKAEDQLNIEAMVSAVVATRRTSWRVGRRTGGDVERRDPPTSPVRIDRRRER